MELDGMEWNWMEWNGIGWNGMELDGMEWNWMELYVPVRFIIIKCNKKITIFSIKTIPYADLFCYI